MLSFLANACDLTRAWLNCIVFDFDLDIANIAIGLNEATKIN